MEGAGPRPAALPGLLVAGPLARPARIPRPAARAEIVRSGRTPRKGRVDGFPRRRDVVADASPPQVDYPVHRDHRADHLDLRGQFFDKTGERGHSLTNSATAERFDARVQAWAPRFSAAGAVLDAALPTEDVAGAARAFFANAIRLCAEAVRACGVDADGRPSRDARERIARALLYEWFNSSFRSWMPPAQRSAEIKLMWE